MLACWNTSSSNLLIPYAYAQLGVALGPIVQVAIQGMGLLVALGLVEATIVTGASTTGELGETIGGAWGRLLMEASQVGNNLLWLPCAIVLMVDSGQVVLAGTWVSRCNIRLALPFMLLGFVLVQVGRTYANQHMATVAGVSCVLIIVQSACIIGLALTSDVGYTNVAYSLFLPSTSTWYDIANGVSCLLYSFAPCFVIVEIVNAMEKPSDAKMAVILAWVFSSSLYFVIGVSVVLAWGGGVEEPITDNMGTGTLAVVAATITILSTAYDYVISATVVNRLILQFTKSDCDPTDNSWATAIEFASATLPVAIATALIVSFVPQLDSEVGLITGTCITGSGLVLPSWYFLRWRKPGASSEHEALLGSPIVYMEWAAMLHVAIVLGALLFVFVMASTYYSIINTSFAGNFFCDVIG